MIIYGIEKTTESDTIYKNLVDNYYIEKLGSTDKFSDRILYHITAKEDNKIIGCMGIINILTKFQERPTIEEPFSHKPVPNYYAFFHLVVHPDYRNNGVAIGIIRMAAKFLIELGAVMIRNHKRSNTISHETFTELGFVLTDFRDESLEYKWTYELDVSNVDINMLNNNFWSKYAIS